MKKLIASLLLGAMVAVASAEIYSREVVAIADGETGEYEHDVMYTSAKLVRVWQQSWSATNDLTITRVTSDGLYTNTVGTITAGATVPRNTATFTAGYLAYGDTLVITPNPVTGGVVIIEFEVQR